MVNENCIYRLIDLNKTIRNKGVSREILHSINLKVQADDFVCIMGPTGCGKSSLIRIMAGLDSYTDGMMNYKGMEMNAGIPKHLRRQIGVAYQSDSLFNWLTVEQNIRQPIDVFKLKKEMDVPARVGQMLRLTGLEQYKDCYPIELSGGMRQRCAFGRALAHNPDVLLLDQPFGALDAITRKLLQKELLKIWHAEGKTIVMVTNNIAEALFLAKRIVVLSPAPAGIRKVINVPLTYEERMSGIQENETYLALSEELSGLIHDENQPERKLKEAI